MRGVFRQKTSRYWWIAYAGVDGKVIRESSKSTRKPDAEALLRQRKQEVDDGKNPHKRPIPNVTLKEFAPEYLAGKKNVQKSFDKTVRMVNQLINDLGNITLNRFNYTLVEDWKINRLNRKLKNGKQTEYGTVFRYYGVLKNMLKTAKNRRKMSQEAYESVLEMKMKKPKNKRMRYLSPDECDRLISECYGHLRPIVITASHTGMRLDEILKTRWQNIDLDYNRINPDALMTKDFENRSIPLTKTLKSTLKEIERRPHIEYVYWNPITGKPYVDIKHSFQNALKRAKIIDFTFRDLRRTFASNFIMAGGSISELEGIMGHQSTEMTKWYIQLSTEYVKAGMEKFEERMIGKLESRKAANS